MSQTSDGSETQLSRISVLISGSGSNLQALLESCNTTALPDAQIVRVISDRKNAHGLTRAENVGIATTYHGILPYKKKYPDANAIFEEARLAYDADLASLILADKPDIVVCAGFMRIVTIAFLDLLKQAQVRIINLHPSLHGDIIGAGAIERAWEEYQQGKRTKTGVMIHYVIAEVDMGEPIVQKEVDINGCKDLEDLQERIHQCEHELIVEATRIVLKGKVK